MWCGPHRSRTPERPRREEDAKRPGHPDCIECPDEEEGAGRPFDANAGAGHMDDRHLHRQERSEEENDQPPSAIAPQQCSAQIDGEDAASNEIREASSREPSTMSSAMCNDIKTIETSDVRTSRTFGFIANSPGDGRRTIATVRTSRRHPDFGVNACSGTLCGMRLVDQAPEKLRACLVALGITGLRVGGEVARPIGDALKPKRAG